MSGRSLEEAERNYMTIERELLALYFASRALLCICKYRHYFEDTRLPKIKVFTDHKALCQDLNADNQNRRISHRQLELSKYDLQMTYLKGLKNPADMPSRRVDFVKIPSRLAGAARMTLTVLSWQALIGHSRPNSVQLRSVLVV